MTDDRAMSAHALDLLASETAHCFLTIAAAADARPLSALSLGKARDGAYVHRPVERRAAPHLHLRPQLRALPDRADAQQERWRIGHRRSPIQWRAAFGTERLRALVAAFSSLHHLLRLAAMKRDVLFRYRHVDAKR